MRKSASRPTIKRGTEGFTMVEMEIKGTKPDKATPAPVLAKVSIPVPMADGAGITALAKVFGKHYGQEDGVALVGRFLAGSVGSASLAHVRADYLKATTDEERKAILSAASNTLPIIPKSGDPVKRTVKAINAKLATLTPEKLAALLAQIG
jgi:hypothetical protein